MPSINLDNLERYDSKARNEAEEEYMPKDSGNWQKTEEAGAVSFYPVGGSPLEGKVKFSFTETLPASGDKSPTNPSTITGVSNVKVTRCGKNLLNMAGISGFTQNGVTFVVDSNAGTVTVTSDGPATADTTFYVAVWPNMKMYADQQYFLSGCPSGGSATTYYLGGSFYSEDGVYGGGMASDFGSGALLVKEFNWRYNCIIRIRSGVTVSNLVFKPQLELGSTATVFEPYAGTDYTVNLGNTYYGGEIDLATGLMTVTHVGYVLSSELGLFTTSVTYVYRTASFGNATTDNPATATCSHYQKANTATLADMSVNSMLFRNDGMLIVKTDGLSLQQFKDFADAQISNGTPIVATYPLRHPLTVQLSPTSISALAQTDKCIPRLNTVYTDAESIQIGYMKSPQRTEQEITQALLELESD